VDSQRRNRYLDAMGVDVWVRRPGGPLAGLGSWDAPALAPELSEDVTTASEPVRPAAEPMRVAADGAASRPVGKGPFARAPETLSPPASPAPFEPASGDIAARWDALRTEVLTCTKCILHQTRTQGVLGVGPRQTNWMVIGEAPGAEEDRRGEPFVGRAGHLLDAMLHAIGLSRGTNVYIANVLKSRPPGNRDPRPEEVAACLPYLVRQIELLQPRLMLAVGRIAAQNLLSTDLSLGRLRGKVHHFGELNTPLIVTYHPAYLLRTPADKSKAWEDLKFARSVFRQLTDRVGTDGDLS
jgi:uracil-DNA glycosylase family 4